MLVVFAISVGILKLAVNELCHLIIGVVFPVTTKLAGNVPGAIDWLAPNTIAFVNVSLELVTVTAPEILKICPFKVHPVPMPTIPASQIKVPAKTELAPAAKAPSIIQKTLEAAAPFVNLIFVAAVNANAPGILKIKTALGFPPPSRVIVPAIVDAIGI